MPRYGMKPRNSFKPVEAGAHVAWLVQFIDLGTHVETTQWGTKEQRKGRFTFALPDQLTDQGLPMVIGTTMTLSGHEKANFRKMCGKWMSRAFTDKEFGAFDERELFNVPVILTVVHLTGDDGSPYAVIQDYMPLMRNMQATPLPDDYPYIYLSLEPELFDNNEYEKLSTLSEKTANSYREKIESSPEWGVLCNPPAVPAETDPEWITEDPIDEQPAEDAQPEPEPEPAPAPAPRPSARPAAPAASAAARPAAPTPQARPLAAAPAPTRTAPAAPQRPAAPAARPAAPVARTSAPAPIARATGPAPARPTPGPGSVSSRATGGPAAPAANPVARKPLVDPDVDEIPF